MLRGEGLAAIRGERLIFRDLDFALEAAGALLLTGPNGSGKSTLMRLIAGLLRPAAGRLSWAGEDALADLPAHAARLAYVGHLDAVKPALTVAENLGLATRPAPAARAAALAAMALAPLGALPARLLSAGQKRRLALARLALSPAPLWLLDEPSLGLDTTSLARLGALLAGHRARGGLVIAATHLDLPLPGAAVLALP